MWGCCRWFFRSRPIVANLLAAVEFGVDHLSDGVEELTTVVGEMCVYRLLFGVRERGGHGFGF